MHTTIGTTVSQLATLRIPADPDRLAGVRSFLRETAAARGVRPEAVPDVVQAVDESVCNIIVHGYRGNPGSIEIFVDREGDDLVVRLRDQGPTFDPTSVPTPDLDLPLDARRPGGMGVHLARQLMDEVRHRVPPGSGNELTLVKRGAFPAAAIGR
jgi:anti-sigma regulatory factor (Ser/Thr protein kinase)